MNDVKIDPTPPCDIRIDKEGVWYFRGAEMFRREIVNLFYEHMYRDEAGRYIIELPDDRCFIEVEDAPFVVKSVSKYNDGNGGEDVLVVDLSDDKTEELDPSRVWIGDDNVPYCRIKEDRFHARFTRNGYYQLARYIEFDDDRQAFCIRLNNRRHYLGDPPKERP
jgi:uncharacterized protein